MWGSLIIDAEKGGGFTDDDRALAGEWFSCACGQLDESIPRIDDEQGSYRPADGYLFDLGMSFYSDVCADDYIAAAHCVLNIDAREAQLIGNQGAA